MKCKRSKMKKKKTMATMKKRRKDKQSHRCLFLSLFAVQSNRCASNTVDSEYWMLVSQLINIQWSGACGLWLWNRRRNRMLTKTSDRFNAIDYLIISRLSSIQRNMIENLFLWIQAVRLDWSEQWRTEIVFASARAVLRFIEQVADKNSQRKWKATIANEKHQRQWWQRISCLHLLISISQKKMYNPIVVRRKTHCQSTHTATHVSHGVKLKV